MTLDCPQLAKLYAQLQTAKSHFDADLANAQTTVKTKDIFSAKLAISEAKGKRTIMRKILDEIQFEKLINLSEEYEIQKNVLTDLGDLEKLSNGQLGIKGIDPADLMNPDKTKEYIFPSKEVIKQKLLANRELYQLKIKQGFTRLLITPFALPLKKLVDKYSAELKEKYRANGNKIYSAGPNSYHPSSTLSALRTLDLDINKPVMVWDGLEQADINGSLKYYPNQFIKATEGYCFGYTKQEIIKNPVNPFPGFKITLIPQNPIITNSKYLENLHQALRLTKDTDKKSIYYGTCGQTPEDALNLYRQTLLLTNQVLDDCKGNAKSSYCLGAYMDTSSRVPELCWNFNNNRRSNLQGCTPNARSLTYEFRLSVKVL